ncbi:hypothetical protein evm_002770 [Chilo suppressalis]|nr:hypothetical protein evm_002770 [Chilo suppressalis]
MNSDYYDVASELDPREILHYLNTLGINNISGEILKYFITDLKKLIKYDLEQKKEGNNIAKKPDVSGPERLHSASTFSSRIRSRCQENISMTCGRHCQKRKSCTIRSIHSAPVLGQYKKENNVNVKPIRSCSCANVKRKPEAVLDETAPTSSNNLIKVKKQPQKKKCDPVSLYHYYTALWAKYKPNVPGENDWSDLRWSVRQKMAGNIPKPTTKKT